MNLVQIQSDNFIIVARVSQTGSLSTLLLEISPNGDLLHARLI